jgi:anaerobic selenocysteine-containing dehydrogenase
MYDRAVGTVASTSLANLAVGAAVYLNPRDAEAIGTAAGRDVRVSTSRTSIVLSVRIDPGVTKGTAWVPFNQPGADVRELISNEQPVVDVRVENLK